MLYASLILSAVLLVAVNRMVARWRYAVPGTIALGIAFTVLPLCMMVAFPAVAIQSLLMCALLLILLWPNRGRRLYLPLSCLATLVAYGILLESAYEKHQQTVSLRQEYPFEPIDDRLPSVAIAKAATPKHPEKLTNLETAIEKESGDRYYSSRSASLQRLHERSVDEFVNSAGFGVGRMGMMAQRPDSESLKRGLRDDVAVPQPDYLNPYFPSTWTLSETLISWDAVKMGRLHDDGVLDFVNPKGFGYFKSRREVAGFQSHGMSKLQDPVPPWKVARIDLIGLIIHEKPVAYISANLPKMDEIRKAPTRPLDAFETEALAELRKGEDEFTRGAEDKVRMVGAIRATKQCLECHGVTRGDLLGAFSYGFRREEKK